MKQFSGIIIYLRYINRNMYNKDYLGWKRKSQVEIQTNWDGVKAMKKALCKSANLKWGQMDKLLKREIYVK